MKWLGLLGICLISGCASIAEGLEPVTGFDIQRFMGRWYEIERLNNENEAGLIRVYAEYRLLSDGKIEVLNQGFHPRQNRWIQAKGLAWFEGNKDVGSLKLSFGTPLTKNYHVLMVDAHYRYAIVAGSDRDGLWILSREPQLDPSILESLVAKAKSLDFPVKNLVVVEQEPSEK